jgi:1-deoxy-D-xylulose-5-phosphate reductoisomerase
MPCILNAANEIAVKAFLDNKVGFTQMPEIVEYTMENSFYSPSPDLDFLEATDAGARETALDYINKLQKQR